jgi:hypothetical protein
MILIYTIPHISRNSTLEMRTEFSHSHNSVTAENGTHVGITFFIVNDHRNNLLTLTNKMVKHPVCDTRFKGGFLKWWSHLIRMDERLSMFLKNCGISRSQKSQAEMYRMIYGSWK